MNTRQMENQKRILAAKYGVKKSQITDKDVETYRSDNQIRRQSKAIYKGLGPKGTKVITESLSPEHIVGSKKYIKNSPKEVLNYIKHNPKRFAKGLGIYGLVGTGATVGGKAIVDAQREANKLKTLEGLRNKAKQEKQKKEAFEYINELYMEKVASLQIY